MSGKKLTRKQAREGRKALRNRRGGHSFAYNLFRALVATSAIVALILTLVMYREICAPDAGLAELNWDDAYVGQADVIIVPADAGPLNFFIHGPEGDLFRLRLLGTVDPAKVRDLRVLESIRLNK